MRNFYIHVKYNDCSSSESSKLYTKLSTANVIHKIITLKIFIHQLTGSERKNKIKKNVTNLTTKRSSCPHIHHNHIPHSPQIHYRVRLTAARSPLGPLKLSTQPCQQFTDKRNDIINMASCCNTMTSMYASNTAYTVHTHA